MIKTKIVEFNYSAVVNLPLKVYLIGSLRNERIPVIANELRAAGFDVFDDWFAIGPEADDHWKQYEQGRGRTYQQALQGKVCENAFNFDKRHIDAADVGVLVLPAGKSAHTELGYMTGKGKKTFVLIDGDNERWDIMYKFFSGVAYSVEELVGAINGEA
jgi:hypothetical protein